MRIPAWSEGVVGVLHARMRRRRLQRAGPRIVISRCVVGVVRRSIPVRESRLSWGMCIRPKHLEADVEMDKGGGEAASLRLASLNTVRACVEKLSDILRHAV